MGTSQTELVASPPAPFYFLPSINNLAACGVLSFSLHALPHGLLLGDGMPYHPRDGPNAPTERPHVPMRTHSDPHRRAGWTSSGYVLGWLQHIEPPELAARAVQAGCAPQGASTQPMRRAFRLAFFLFPFSFFHFFFHFSLLFVFPFFPSFFLILTILFPFSSF